MPPNQVPFQAAAVKARHARNSSGTSSPRPDARPAKKQPDPPSPPPRRVHYNLIIRLPFPRGDFADPPQIDWDQEKDKKLWSIIANNAKIDNWEELANEFDVPLSFILQQAAWLYQRQMDSVREQMRKVGASNAPTPTPGSQPLTAGGIAMKRLGSGRGSRAPSQLSIRPRDSPIPRAGESGPGTPKPGAPGISRTPSTTTVSQTRSVAPPSPRQPVQRSFRAANVSAPRKLDTTPRPATQEAASTVSSPAESSSSSSSEDETPLHRSNIFRRPNPRFQPHKKSALGQFITDEASNSSDEESPTFLPSTKSPPSPPSARFDPSATLRGVGKEKAAQSKTASDTSASSPDKANPPTASEKGKQKAPPTSSTASSTHSAPQGQLIAPAALSPRHRAELARLGSPRKQSRHDGSDGTPSMGSSFSDLEGTSTFPTPLIFEVAADFFWRVVNSISSS